MYIQGCGVFFYFSFQHTVSFFIFYLSRLTVRWVYLSILSMKCLAGIREVLFEAKEITLMAASHFMLIVDRIPAI